MAAGTNWKRPWEDDARGEERSPQAAPYARRPSLIPPLRTPVGQESGRSGSTPVELQHLGAIGEAFHSNSGPSQYLSPFDRSCGQPEQPLNYQLNSVVPSKRQRVEDKEWPYESTPNSSVPSSVPIPSDTQIRDRLAIQLGQTKHRKTGPAPRFNLTYEHGSFSSEKSMDEPTDSPKSRSPSETEIQTWCQTCRGLRGLIHQVVRVTDSLYSDLLVLPASDMLRDQEAAGGASFRSGEPRTHDRPLESLEWVVDRMNASIQLARGFLGSRPRIPSNMAESMIYGNATQTAPALTENLSSKWEQEDGLDYRRKNFSPPLSEEGRGRSHHPLARSIPEGGRRKSIAGDFTRSQVAYSPLTSGPSHSSHSMLPQSPMQAPPSSRPLLSPTSLNFSSHSQALPPMSPSFFAPKSPHTAHLQELQHQLSTKSLAHQILQGEHDKLLAAFSRSQTRCATLDRKSHVSDVEINNLVEERIRLQARVDSMESQIDELQQSRDEAHKQSVASGSQYMKIMGMSSKLQAQAASDLKKWKTDRDAWETEKETLLHRVAVLENSRELQPRDSQEAASTTSIEGEPSAVPSSSLLSSGGLDDILSSNSIERLHREIVRLQKRCREFEGSATAWRRDTIDLRGVLLGLNAVGDRMYQRLTEPDASAPGSTEVRGA